MPSPGRAGEVDREDETGTWTTDHPCGQIEIILCLHITQDILRDMQVPTPPLLPLLRSRIQADLLTLLLLSPGREWSLTELAARTDTSVATAQREVSRAEQAGVVTSRKLGNTRLVKAADSPLTQPLTELLLRSFGPRQVIAEELAPLAGIETAYLFGSWAARYTGHPGHPPADIDVLVIGAPDRDDLDDAAQRAGRRLSREVNVTVRSPEWWAEGADGFHAEIAKRPHVLVMGQTPSDTSPPRLTRPTPATCLAPTNLPMTP